MNGIDVFSPTSLDEAFSLIKQQGRKAMIIAGGTDVLVKLKNNKITADCLINIKGIKKLDALTYDRESGLRIGALATLSAIECAEIVKEKLPVLAETVKKIGTPGIRKSATVAGNLCNAAPSADMAPLLMVLDAKVKLAWENGEKIVSINQFFKGPGETILQPGQIITEIQVPNLPPSSSVTYLKHSRVKGADLAQVGVAVMLQMAGDTISDIRIALGAVAPTPIRSREAEKILLGKAATEKLIIDSGMAATREASPINDQRSSADYRREIIVILVRKAVNSAMKQIRGES
jgi:carbon-monoxide dehydrogenase medium subunit